MLQSNLLVREEEIMYFPECAFVLQRHALG
jgi:hypothetical protein